MVQLTILVNENFDHFMINRTELNNSICIKSSKEEITLEYNKYGGTNIDTNTKCKCIMRDVLCVRNLHSISVNSGEDNKSCANFESNTSYFKFPTSYSTPRPRIF